MWPQVICLAQLSIIMAFVRNIMLLTNTVFDSRKMKNKYLEREPSFGRCFDTNTRLTEVKVSNDQENGAVRKKSPLQNPRWETT